MQRNLHSAHFMVHLATLVHLGLCSTDNTPQFWNHRQGRGCSDATPQDLPAPRQGTHYLVQGWEATWKTYHIGSSSPPHLGSGTPSYDRFMTSSLNTSTAGHATLHAGPLASRCRSAHPRARHTPGLGTWEQPEPLTSPRFPKNLGQGIWVEGSATKLGSGAPLWDAGTFPPPPQNCFLPPTSAFPQESLGFVEAHTTLQLGRDLPATQIGFGRCFWDLLQVEHWEPGTDLTFGRLPGGWLSPSEGAFP